MKTLTLLLALSALTMALPTVQASQTHSMPFQIGSRIPEGCPGAEISLFTDKAVYTPGESVSFQIVLPQNPEYLRREDSWQDLSVTLYVQDPSGNAIPAE